MKNKLTALSLLTLVCFFKLSSSCHAAYDLEVPADPWEEYRLQFVKYSRQMTKSYDRSFVFDYASALAEAAKAIDIMPDEGLAYAERARIYRIMNNQREADRDFRKALTLFDQAIMRYRPGKSEKKSDKATYRQVTDADSAKLITTLQYQRGEAYFSMEQYRKAREDFDSSCKGGNSVACTRLQDVDMIEKLGSGWVPLFERQFYDRQRVERISRDLVRVWVWLGEANASHIDSGRVGKTQRLELKCSTRDVRVVEGSIVSANGEKTPDKSDTEFSRPLPGSIGGKLMAMFCSP